jgi:hypothetical protein
MRLVSFAVAAALTILSAAALAQTDAPKGDTGSYASAGTPPTSYPLPKVDNGSPGLDLAGPDGSTKEVRPVPCSAAAQETDGSTTCVGIEAEMKPRP